ncbi:FtsB family cell division protein [Bounagaea algeriensis]
MTAPTRNNRTGQKRSQSSRKGAGSSRKGAETPRKGAGKTTEDTAPREERRSGSGTGRRAPSRREGRTGRSSGRGGQSTPSGKAQNGTSAARTGQATKSRAATSGTRTQQGTQRTAKKQSPRSRTAAPQSSPVVLRVRSALDRIPLVGVVMTLLGVGLAATLWLSIAAVSGSYQLQQGQAELNSLSERKEELMREVNTLNSSPMIQQRAEQQGMVPGPMPAHLVQRPDGSVQVIGDPEQAQAPAPPPPREPAGQQGEQNGRQPNGGDPQSAQDGGRPAQGEPNQAAGPAGDDRTAGGGNQQDSGQQEGDQQGGGQQREGQPAPGAQHAADAPAEGAR